MGKRKFKLSTHRKNEERKKQQLRVNQRPEKCMLLIYAIVFCSNTVESPDTDHPQPSGIHTATVSLLFNAFLDTIQPVLPNNSMNSSEADSSYENGILQ